MNEKKQSILDASLKLFVENGFHGTSTAEIAKTAEVATGTLFHYFKTKEELINRLYLLTKENMLNEAKGIYDDNKTFKENIKLYGSNLIISVLIIHICFSLFLSSTVLII